MPENLEKPFAYSLALLPGYLSFFLFVYVSGIAMPSGGALFFSGLAFSVFNAGLSFGLFKTWNFLWTPRVPARRTPGGGVAASFVIFLVLVSLGSGIFSGIVHANDWFFSGLRGVAVVPTISTKRPLAHILYQNQRKNIPDARPGTDDAPQAWSRIHLRNGEVFEGFPELWSDKAGGGVYLSGSCNVEKQNGALKITLNEGPGVFVYEREIRFIEFVDTVASSCALKFAIRAKMREKSAKRPKN